MAESANDEELVRSIARWERISGILWIGLAVLQILAVVTAAAGAWNIYAAMSRFRMASAIESRERWIPAAFEPISPLITMGLINFVLGGVVGVFFILIDLWIRKRVLENAHAFDVEFELTPDEPLAELPQTYGQQIVADEDEAADDPA